MIGDNLRLHRLVSAGAALLQQLAPLLHALLGCDEEAAILFAGKQRQQRPQHIPAVADETDIRRIAEANTRGIDIDLHGLRLTRLWIELYIWEATPSDNQGVALLHGILCSR